MLPELNLLFSPKNIDRVETTMLAPGCELADTVRNLQKGGAMDVPETGIAFLQSVPVALQEAVRAVLYSAVTRSPRLPVMFAWAPGYDYELTISEATGSRETSGGITVLLRSPYTRS
jgi:hypothetical protein